MIYECPCGETFSTLSFERHVEIPWVPWFTLKTDMLDEREDGLCPACASKLKSYLLKLESTK